VLCQPGPWVNKQWLNELATLILGVLVMLSLILVIATIFPGVNVGELMVVLAGVLAVGLIGNQATVNFADGRSSSRRRTAELEAISRTVFGTIGMHCQR
jgi:hypothetical protein